MGCLRPERRRMAGVLIAPPETTTARARTVRGAACGPMWVQGYKGTETDHLNGGSTWVINPTYQSPANRVRLER